MLTESGQTPVVQIPYCLLALLGASLAWKAGVQGRRFLGLLVPLLLYSWGMTIVVLSIVRYMVPVLGLFAILVGLSLSELMDRAFPQVGSSRRGRGSTPGYDGVTRGSPRPSLRYAGGAGHLGQPARPGAPVPW